MNWQISTVKLYHQMMNHHGVTFVWACQDWHSSGVLVYTGDRGVRQFLQQHGVTGMTAQRLLDEYGSSAEEAVRQDPYSALIKTCQGSTFRSVCNFFLHSSLGRLMMPQSQSSLA